jgi:two-component system, LuxR family, sensor kinase FixL
MPVNFKWQPVFLLGMNGMSEPTASRVSPARFVSVLDIASDGIVVIDRAQTIVLFNRGAESIFGYPAAEALGSAFEGLLPERYRGEHLGHVLTFAASAATARLMGERRTVVGLRQDGVEFPAEVSICKFEEQGELYFAAIVRDVSERKKAENAMVQLNQALEERVRLRTAELEASNQRLHGYVAELQSRSDELRVTTQQLWQAAKLATVGELAASIAHELNNPLGTVSLRIESILAQTSPTDPRHKLLGIVEQEVERMAHLVSNLLQFSRAGSEQASTVEVPQEIQMTLELVLHNLRRRGIEVVQDLEPGLPAIFADRQKLRQVFLNLLTNAGDAMPDGGKLTIRARRDSAPARPDAVVIEVTDTGVGIAAENLPRVMDPFFTTKEEGKGTGLGLAICKRIVQEHKGSIQIDSCVGKGTTIRISIPVLSPGNVRALSQENKRG